MWLAVFLDTDGTPRLGAVLLASGILPIALIKQRSLEGAYIPVAGLMLVVAWALDSPGTGTSSPR